MEEKFKLKGKYCIKVKQSDDPSNINWENVNL